MSITLTAEKRELVGRKAKRLRKNQVVPAVVYGPTCEPTSVQVCQKALQGVLKEAGSTKLINLEVDGTTYEVLARAVERSLDQQNFKHIDFYAPDQNKPVKSTVPVRLIGETPLVAAGGVLITPSSTVAVSALPKNLPSEIVVDLSFIQTFSNVITVGSLELPEGVKAVTRPGTSLAYVAQTRATRAAAAESKSH